MTREEFNSKSFEEVMEQLYQEVDEVTTIDRLKDFIKEKVDEEDFNVASHLCNAIWNDPNPDNSDWYLYDYCMISLYKKKNDIGIRDYDIKYDQRYDSDEYETTTLFFDAPKELGYIWRNYPDAESGVICLEFPQNKIEAKEAALGISPIKDESAYDWNDLDLPIEDIEYLIDLAMKSEQWTK